MSSERRPYRMTVRAEQEALTRQRITESTIALHELVGPAQTTISAIAERAGVRRSTVYRHFPNEDALFAACSSHWREANPAPDPGSWARIENPAQRTRTALRELYAFYGRTHHMYESLLRDEPLVPVVQRLLRDFHGYLEHATTVLAAGHPRKGKTRAAIGHALAFTTWRSLVQEQGLRDSDAVELMCLLVDRA